MSTEKSKTASSHQKKAQNKTGRLEEKGEDASLLTTDAQAPGAAGILEAIAALKNNVGSEFDEVLTAINEIKSDFKDFSARLEQAEDRIGDVEDDIAGEKAKIAILEKQVSELTSKVDDLARKKGRIMYKGHNVMFFHDISTELHKKRKRFDDVKRRLRDLKMDYGIIYPAKLRLFYVGKPCVFADLAGVESFIKNLET